MSKLPYTKRRAALRDAIAAGNVYGYAWAPMQAYLRDGVDEEFVAGRVREFLKHELARFKWGGTGEREPIVLTQAGEAWPEGPGSTSPTPHRVITRVADVGYWEACCTVCEWRAGQRADKTVEELAAEHRNETCGDCGRLVPGDGSDEGHGHCGPLPHTGPLPPCDRCGGPGSTSPEPGPRADPNFNPAYRVARCGQLSAHGPHVMEHGPDQPRNCPGTARAATKGGTE